MDTEFETKYLEISMGPNNTQSQCVISRLFFGEQGIDQLRSVVDLRGVLPVAELCTSAVWLGHVSVCN